jgi:hypothetical protein
LVYPLNRVVQSRFGVLALLATSPVWEETAKVMTASLLGGVLPAVHLLFGFIEAVADWRTSGRNGGQAAVLSIVSHGVFALAAAIAVAAYTTVTAHPHGSGRFYIPSEMLLAWIVSLLAHLLWNRAVIMMQHPRG